MPTETFWSRVRKGRLFQVLAVYLGVSWFVLQAVDVLNSTLRLPSWVGPSAFILLVVGLVVTVATAWVQDRPLIERRERADEVPGSWELALQTVGSILRKDTRDLPQVSLASVTTTSLPGLKAYVEGEVLFRLFVTNWANAHAGLMPRVEDAKQRLARLGGDTRR